MDKKTLQKKIESGDTVWTTYWESGLSELNLKEDEERYWEIEDDYLFKYLKLPHYAILRIPIETIIDSREEAEWLLEFGNIKRTEKLEMPSWEKMQKIERFDFKGKDGYRYTMNFISGFKTLAITGIIENKYYGEATYENYLEACRICKKLFLGEEL